MPLYEFRCEQGHLWETNIPIQDRDLEHLCEDCGTKGKRVFYPNVIQFNAKDFYSTENPKR